jgi:hypothetical protein
MSLHSRGVEQGPRQLTNPRPFPDSPSEEACPWRNFGPAGHSVKASDEIIKDRVRDALKADKSVDGISVAWNVDGVSRVASEIETSVK